MSQSMHLTPRGVWRPCRVQPSSRRGCPYVTHAGVSWASGKTTWDVTDAVDAPFALKPRGDDRSPAQRDADARAGHLHGYPVRIAPPGSSASACSVCGRYLPRGWQGKLVDNPGGADNGQVRCPGCATSQNPNEVVVDIRHEELQWLDDERVRQGPWFHITTMPDWADAIRQDPAGLYVHLGSREAALDRLAELRRNHEPGEAQYYMYEVALAPETHVAEGIFSDIGIGWPNDEPEMAAGRVLPGEAGGRPYDYSPTGVSRYLNQYEGQGTISLLANVKAFTVQAGRALDL